MFIGASVEKLQHQVENCGDDRKAQVDLLKAVKCYNEQLQLARDAAAKAKEEARAAAEARNTDPMEEDGLDEEQKKIRALAKASARVSPYQAEGMGPQVAWGLRDPGWCHQGLVVAHSGLWPRVFVSLHHCACA